MSEVHVLALYGQMAAIGSVWSLLHCAGMCGPLLLVFRVGDGVDACNGRYALTDLGAYQCGRACLYVSGGAMAGWLGAGFTAGLRADGRWLIMILASVFLISGMWLGWRTVRPRPTRIYNSSTPWAARLARLLVQPANSLHMHVNNTRCSRIHRLFLLGMAMAFLPCGIIFWSLGLAAATASPLHGALIMLLTTILTSIPLALVTRLGGGWRPHASAGAGRWLVPVSWMLSGAWLLVLMLATPAERWCHAG